MDECVQCRGCEAACPSSVQFGHLMEQTRAALHDAASRRRGCGAPPSGSRYRLLLPVPRAAARGHVGRVARAAAAPACPRRLGLPRLSARSLATPLDVPRRRRPDAWCFTGCVMDAWLRDTHRSTRAA